MPLAWTAWQPLSICYAVLTLPLLSSTRRCQVYWPDDGAWYVATVEDFDLLRGRHRLAYEDGDAWEEDVAGELRHGRLRFDPPLTDMMMPGPGGGRGCRGRGRGRGPGLRSRTPGPLRRRGGTGRAASARSPRTCSPRTTVAPW